MTQETNSKPKKDWKETAKTEIKQNWGYYLLTGIGFVLGALVASPSSDTTRQANTGRKFENNWKK